MGKNTVGGPLSRICYEDSNFLLEAMLPFVPVQFKLLLAMMIKWNEVQRIIRVFQDPGGLASYGLEDQPFSFSKLMSELAACPNPALSGGMEQMSQMMQMMQMAQMMQNMPGQADAASAVVGDASSNLSDTIDRIIAAYASPPEHTGDAGPVSVGAVQEPVDAGQPDPLENLDIDQFVKEIFS